MKFGDVDINTEVDWSVWTWKEFVLFHQSLKIEHPVEDVADALGVKRPRKVKKD